MAEISKATVFALYRTFRRQISILPSEYLRQFFRIKVADDVRSILTASGPDGKLQRTKFKRFRRELRKLEAAHAGDHEAYAHILDVAYGRKGKLKWEIMEPLLSDPDAPVPDRIIPAVEKSRPPVYSPALSALLTSGLSRDKPLSTKALVNPPTLPKRADANSEEAHLLGPLSKRREVNIRWRFFEAEWKKVHPPLQVGVTESATAKDAQPDVRTDIASLAQARIRGIGLQDSGVLEDLISAAGPAFSSQPQTRRERAASPKGSSIQDPDPERRPLPRFIRRRFRELLARTPILNYWDKGKQSRGRSGSYSVSMASSALSPSTRFGGGKVPEAHDLYLTWVGKPMSKKKPSNDADGMD